MSLRRWKLAVCAETLPMKANSPAGSARPSTNATRIAARAGSPISPAINAMSDPSSTRVMVTQQLRITVRFQSN